MADRIELVGKEVEVEEARLALMNRQPVMLYGPTGDGKTLTARVVAEQVSEELDVPVVYFQLYPEMTKNSLIGGETIKDGSVVVEEQSIIRFGQEGAIFIIDECTHTTESVLLAFNSLIEEPFSTVVGNKVYKLSDKTRFIFCANLPDHAGNIHLPISFANRLHIIRTETPTEENLIDIGKAACADTPENLLRFFAEIIVKTHEPSFPISPRNIVMLSRSIPNIFETGYEDIDNPGIPAHVKTSCENHNINLDRLKRLANALLMANVVIPSQGPDKIKALLW